MTHLSSSDYIVSSYLMNYFFLIINYYFIDLNLLLTVLEWESVAKTR
jgi:hypothetical protein